MTSIVQQIAKELEVKLPQVEAAINLLDEGATVPFIARYRKEKTQGLTDTHLRQLEQRLQYLRELEDRRGVILKNIEQQSLLTDALKQQILSADSKTRLEDLYLPFKPKRRTKGQIAIEAGIKPLADKLLADLSLTPEKEAQDYINASAGFAESGEVLAGASAILIEQLAEQADLILTIRNHLKKYAFLTSKVVKTKQKEATKYKDYFEHNEKFSSVPSHRALAMFRGKNEGFLRLSLTASPQREIPLKDDGEKLIREHLNVILNNQPAANFLKEMITQAWKQKLLPALETEFFGQLKETAEKSAIGVFANNLKDLLMAAPAGDKVTLALDPGLRTGCKLAVVDATGKLLHTSTIFPHEPQNNWDKSVRTIVNLVRQHKIELIAIGNGTASRETDKLAGEAIKHLDGLDVKKIIVSEAGASVYSASELAANEFPDVDVSLRGAISIGRRLQDPMAELVKIEPKSIGVGQYQHDVSQSALSTTLEGVVEDCVNAVGVDLNSASIPLLSKIAGLNKTIATNIVNYRNEHGKFKDRKTLLKVARLGPKAFEQAAGFLRITDGTNPIERSGVHPETYCLVEDICQQLNASIDDIIGNEAMIATVNSNSFSDGEFGELTINDVLAELAKPGRDPRGDFKTASFKAGVETIADLKEGMILEGVISNVANFGAFVDVGVHQDGLVHISALTNKFVSDPRDVVKAGDIVQVKVTEVDVARKRISLTMRLDEQVQANAKPQHKPHQEHYKSKPAAKSKAKSKPKAAANAAMGNAFADAFAKLKK